ncbi:DUF2851 family protein [Alistipes communis]|uniref:DUF2851 family protein n=1 Tax=Alistipes communis TaxID=2585118 RepID=UPI003A889277
MTDEELRRTEHRLLAGAATYACGGYIARLDALHRNDLYTRLAYDRLERKYDVVRELFAESDSNWNQTFYVLLFRTIGDVTNRDAFLTLARRVSYRMVLRERASLHAVEAMLIGASGLLDNYRDDAYTRSLKQDFDYFSRKYEIAPMTGAEWNLRDIRPANHPLLRIAQLAAFLASNDFLIDRLVECRTAEEVRRLFSAEASDYWYTHYIPATPTRELPKRIGRMKSDLLGINLVSLIQYAYGAYNGNERLRERAFALLEAIPAEENRFMRRWRLYDLHPANAFQSQALLQLATEYCDRRRCAECPVGRRRLAALRQSVPADESLSRH